MSDYFPAEIEIGGKISKSVLEELYEIVQYEGLGWESDAPLPDFDDFLQHIVSVGVIRLSDSEATGGMFQALEAFCQKHDLAYIRHCEAKYEYDAELVWWLPAMEEPISCASNQSGDALLPAEDVKRIAFSKQPDLLRIDELHKYLQEHMPPELPKLEIA